MKRTKVLSAPNTFHSDNYRSSVFESSLTEFLIKFIDRYDNPSVRLYNVVKAVETGSRLPYKCLGAYLCAGPERIVQMLKLPGLGRISAHRFDELATQVAGTFDFQTIRERYASPHLASESICVSTAFDISLDVFLAQYPKATKRLKRAINGAVQSQQCPFPTVSAYLQAGAGRIAVLSKLTNLGAATAQEFEMCVQTALHDLLIARKEIGPFEEGTPLPEQFGLNSR